MEKKILIIGGGIAGLTTALALQKKNIDFVVYEAVPDIKAVGAGITLAGNAMRALRKIGIADEVKAKGHLLSSMIIEDESGKQISVMDAEKLSRDHGLDNVAIHRADLHDVLLRNLPQEKVITNKAAVGIRESEGSVTVYFKDGSTATGQGAIVADGIHSSIRKQLLPHVMPRYSGYTCWRGIVENRWNLQQHAVETWGTHGRFGYVPIGNNKVYWFACKNAAREDKQMQSMRISGLLENFKQYAHPIPEIIRCTPDDQLIWNDIIDLKPISKYAFNRVVLLGDAAHATTPNLGQGACMAMEDALMVAEEMESSADIVLAFKNVEQKRIPRAHFIVNTSYRLGKVAQWENRWSVTLRNFIFRLMPAWVNDRQMAKVLEIG